MDSAVDGDGVLNLMEFAFGTDPTSRLSGLAPLRYTGSLATSGVWEIASLPLPVLDGVPARFFRVKLTVGP